MEEIIYFCWSSQCFQSDISWANIAAGKICGNFVRWAGSFVVDWLISAGGGLLLTPMETRSVSTSTIDFVVGVDKKLTVGSGLFKNCNSFFCTQGAVFGSKRFDHTDGVPCQMMLQERCSLTKI